MDVGHARQSKRDRLPRQRNIPRPNPAQRRARMSNSDLLRRPPPQRKRQDGKNLPSSVTRLPRSQCPVKGYEHKLKRGCPAAWGPRPSRQALAQFGLTLPKRAWLAALGHGSPRSGD